MLRLCPSLRDIVGTFLTELSRLLSNMAKVPPFSVSYSGNILLTLKNYWRFLCKKLDKNFLQVSRVKLFNIRLFIDMLYINLQ